MPNVAGAGGYLGAGSNTSVTTIASGNPPPSTVGPAQLVSGFFTVVNLPCVEGISGHASPVALVSGSFAANANAGSGSRMPAIGITLSGYLSGGNAVIITDGIVMTGWASGWSGFAGVPLYVGSGNQCVTLSGFGASGMGYQRIGVALSGGLLVQPDMIVTSGPVGVFSGTGVTW